MAYFLLEGGSEFGGRMSEPDLRAIELAGGLQASIVILPTAAAPDHNHLRAGRNGQRWFKSLGASRVDVVLVTDKPSADNPEFADACRGRESDLPVGRISALPVRNFARQPGLACGSTSATNRRGDRWEQCRGDGPVQALL